MEYEELVRRAFDAFNSGDPEALREITSPRLRIVPLRAELEDTAFEGPTAIDDFWAEAKRTWSEMRVDVETIEVTGDRAVARGVFRSTASASGAPVESAATWTVTFADGLIEEIVSRAE